NILTLYPCSNPRFPRTASGAERPTQHAPQRGAAEAQACFCFLDKTGCASEKSKQASFFSRLARFFSRLALTFDNLGCASEKSKFQASLILLFLSACTNFAKNFYEEAEIGRGEKSLV
uniref:hypothetical protein n=1 Tax=Candidatus Limisoma sp. TaxID=3076476 RepID=UPI004026CEF5